MAKGTPQPRAKAPPAPVAVRWPALPCPARPLHVDAPADGLLVIDNFLPAPVRTALLAALAALPLQPPAPPRRGQAARTNHRLVLHDPQFAQRLWEDTGLAQALGSLSGRGGRTPKGLNPQLRCYRYPEGTYFGPHYDDDVHDPETGYITEWTLLLYLTGQEDGVVGGETAFYPTPSKRSNGPALVPELRAGRALLHRHGPHCALHEGRLVQQGVKWVLRSDVFFG